MRPKRCFTPGRAGPPLTSTSAFEVISRPQEGPCPPGGVPPFQAGLHRAFHQQQRRLILPFYMRLTRSDGDQDMTKFSSIPPRRVRQAGESRKCSDQASAAAKAKSGRQELAAPSCPANS